MKVSAETQPLLDQYKKLVPPVFVQNGVEKLADETHLFDATFPDCSFTRASFNKEKKRALPNCIAHRGYKAQFPENTLGAFKGAVDIGAHAIETDVHLSKDGVVVLSHDADLKRCFGLKDKIIDCDWSYLKTLKTLKEPRQSMPRLQDLLEYLAQPGLEDIWLLLDIKLDNDSDAVMRLIAKTIFSVDPPSIKPWHTRVVLGAWAGKYLPLANKYLPGFPITHIGFSTSYARQFLKVPNVSFNMLLPILYGPGGRKFIKDVQAQNRPIFAWTVNEVVKMDWCIRRNLDGVITDDPKLYLEVCKKFDERKPEPRMSIRHFMDGIRIWIMALIFGFLMRKKFTKVPEARKRANS